MTFRPSLKQVVVVLLAALAVTSCQKEVSNSGSNSSNGCQLIKITYYDSSRVADSAGIQYANGHVSRINTADLYYTFNYNNNRVTRIDYYQYNGAPAGLVDTVVYNSSGKIQSLVMAAGVMGVYIAMGAYDLAWNGDGTVSKVTEKYISSTSGQLEATYEYNYTWSQSNITQVAIKDLTAGLSDTLHYSFDNTDNYYKKFPSEFIFTDHYLFGINGVQFGSFAPFLFSKNNVNAVESFPVTCSKDGKGNLTELKVASERLATYDYKCQ